MTTAPIRLAYVTAAFPYPLRSGYLRHHHLLQHLVERFDVHLFAMSAGPVNDEDRAAVASFVPDISTFHRVEHRQARLRRLIDPGHATAAALALAAAVGRAVDEDRFDAVVLSGKDTVSVVDAVRGRVPLIIDLCDATSARMTQDLAFSSLLRRGALSIRRRNLRQVEACLVSAGDALTVISERDRELLEAEGAPRRVRSATVVPNGIDLDQWQRRRPTLGHDVAFCGNLGYRPNIDAATHLVLDVMPVVWKRCPAASVTIIGTGASPELQHRLRHRLVTFTGTVPDVRPHLEEAAVFAAPLRIAVGVQNKILEALALGIPVVTSTLAAAGLVTDGEAPPVAKADGAIEMAEAIVDRLVKRATGDDGPDEGGRAWVADRFSWKRSAATLGDLVEGAYRPEEIRC